MKMGTEKFCLRWNDFESNISSAFRELRDDKDFFDITLACEDEQIQAHKIILSACSPFFRNILRRNIHHHPLLYLKGVKYTDLQSVLNFMYHGEVNVAQEELNSFLAVAEDLRVKGLTQSNSQTENPVKESFQTVKKSLPAKPAIRPPERDIIPTHKRPPPSSQIIDNDEIQEIIPVKSEPSDILPVHPQPPKVVPSQQDDLYLHNTSQALAHTEDQDMSMTYQEETYEDYGQYESEQQYDGNMTMDVTNKGYEYLDLMIAEKMIKTFEEATNKSVWKCLECGKEYKLKGDTSRHVEAYHIDHPGLECKVCGRMYKTRESLRGHMNQAHKSIQKL